MPTDKPLLPCERCGATFFRRRDLGCGWESKLPGCPTFNVCWECEDLEEIKNRIIQQNKEIDYLATLSIKELLARIVYQLENKDD